MSNPYHTTSLPNKLLSGIAGVAFSIFTMVKVKKHKKNAHKNPKAPKAIASKRKDDASSGSEDEHEVVVDFEFFNLSELDFHAVKQFLTVSFGSSNHNIDLSLMSSFITEDCADYVGTAVKSEGEQSDPLGFATCIPFKFCKNLDQLSTFLCSKDEERQLGNILENHSCALVLNERFINLPAGIAGPILDNLLADWQRAIKEEPLFKVDYVFYLAPTFTLVKSTLDEEIGESKNSDDIEDDQEQFYYQEAEYLSNLSLFSILFKTATSHSTTDSRRAFTEKGIDASRRLFVLEFKKFIEFVSVVNEKLID